MTEHQSKKSELGEDLHAAIPFFLNTESLHADHTPKDLNALVEDHSENDNLYMNADFITDHLRRHECSVDETQFGNSLEGSDENSRSSSPGQSGTTAAVTTEGHPPSFHSPGSIISKLPISLPDESLIASNRDPKTNQLDITDFIDNFLGDDELMNNVPEILCSMNIEKQSHLSFSPPCEIAPSSSGLRPPDMGMNMTAKAGLSPMALQLKSTPQNPSTYKDQNPAAVKEVAKSFGAKTKMEPLLQKQPHGSYWPPKQDSSPSKLVTTRRSEKRKPRTYSQAVPSQHCHICSRRPTEGSPHQVCGNLQKGRCRKTICTKCFLQFRWDLTAAREAPPGTWECPHCRGQCPQRAQCVIYNRTSDRRRLKLINHRKRKGEDANGSNVKKSKVVASANRAHSGKTTLAHPTPPGSEQRATRTYADSNTAQKKNSGVKIRKKIQRTQEAGRGITVVEDKKISPYAGNSQDELRGGQKMRLGPQQHQGSKGGDEEIKTTDTADMLEEKPGKSESREDKGLLMMMGGTCASTNKYMHRSHSTSGQEERLDKLSATVPQNGMSPAEGTLLFLPNEMLLSVSPQFQFAPTDFSVEQDLNTVGCSDVSGHMRSGGALIEDMWPKAFPQQQGREGEETPDDLWMLPRGGSENYEGQEESVWGRAFAFHTPHK